MEIKACFFLVFTIGISPVSDGQSCTIPGACAMNSAKSYYQFGGYLDACERANSTGNCNVPRSNGKICPARPLSKLVTYGRGSGNTKKVICYGFHQNNFGCRKRGSCRPPRVICRSYDDSPVYPPVLKASLKVKTFYEVDVGESINITCEAENATSYEWIMNTPTGEKSNLTANLQIVNANYKHQGVYFCRAIGKRDSVDSAHQVIVVKGYLQLTVIFDDNGFNNISEKLEQKGFNVSEPENNKQHVFKLLQNSTVLEAYNLLNTTLWNAKMETNSRLTFTIITTGYCLGEETNDTDVGTLTFVATLVGQTANSAEISLTSTSTPRATRRCDGDYKVPAVWEEPVITNVKEDARENVTESIINLVNNIASQPVSIENASYVAQVLENVTAETNQVETEDIEKVVVVLHKVVMTNSTSEAVTVSVIRTVNNLVEISDSNMTEGKLSSNTSASLLQTFEQHIDIVRNRRKTFNFTSTTIEVLIVVVLNPDVWVIYQTIFFGENVVKDPLVTDLIERTDNVGNNNAGKEGEDNNENSHNEVNNQNSDQANKEGKENTGKEYEEGGKEVEKNATVIEVDRSAIGGVLNKNESDDDGLPISFLLHRRPTLFNGGQTDGTKKIDTLIVSASVDGDVTNLPEESNIITRFHSIQGDRCAKPVCVFWDPSLDNDVGGWSDRGCHYVESQEGEEQYTCRCNHLTNFAVLLDVQGDIESKILDKLTIVGCVVSTWCLCVTIFSYLGIKKLRTSRPQQIVLNICFALLGLYLSFLAGINQVRSEIPCVIFGALIHFFTLAVIIWMSVEAVNMYLLFVKVFNAQINYFMIKASFIGWGIPAVIVLISVVLSHESYFNCEYCFPNSSSTVFYVGVLSVVSLLLTFNLVIFVLVTRKLTCARAKMTNRSVSRQETFRRLQNAVAISVLLGVTWITGFFSIGPVRFIFNFLFCLANSFQGCCIFLFFCVRQQEVRSAWMTWLRLSVSRVGPTTASVTTGTDGVTKSKGKSGGKVTSAVSCEDKMKLSDMKSVSEVSVAKDPVNEYAEIGESSYDEVKANPVRSPGPNTYQGYTELDKRHRVLPPLPEEDQYTKRINSAGNPQAYMEITETPVQGSMQGSIQPIAGRDSTSFQSISSEQRAYGFVDFTTSTLLKEANVRSSIMKDSKRKSKSSTRKDLSHKNSK